MFLNRLTVFTKRILLNKLYLAMLLCIITLSVIYALLPDRVKSTDIRVALCIEDNSRGEELFSGLTDSESVYTYYQTDSVEELRKGVESGEFECGFYIPDNFFDGYINGQSDTPKIIRYETASTTLGNAITESVFSQIFKLCATDILYLAYDDPASDELLSERLSAYLGGDKIFQIEDISAKRILDEATTTPVNIPVRQMSVLLIILSGLLGLLMYTRDAERNIYIALTNAQQLTLRLATLLAAVIPMLIVSLACCIVTYRNLSSIPTLFIPALGVVLFSLVYGALFKKSSSLTWLLPVIMLILIPLVVFM